MQADKTSAWEHAGKNWIQQSDLDIPVRKASDLIDCLDKNDTEMIRFPDNLLMKALSTNHLRLTALFDTPSVWWYSQNLLTVITGETLSKSAIQKSGWHARQVEQWIALQTQELTELHSARSKRDNITLRRSRHSKEKPRLMMHILQVVRPTNILLNYVV